MQGGDVVAEGALVGGDADVFAGVEEDAEGELEGFGGAILIVAEEGEEDFELAVGGELGAALGEGGIGAVELAEEAVGGAEAEQGAGQFVGWEAEGDGAFVVGDGVGGAAGGVEGPGELVGDFGDVGVGGVEGAELLEEAGDLAAVAGTGDGGEGGVPGREIVEGHGRSRRNEFWPTRYTKGYERGQRKEGSQRGAGDEGKGGWPMEYTDDTERRSRKKRGRE
jgi:hypothetical protein